jgi:hypothetical protein
MVSGTQTDVRLPLSRIPLRGGSNHLRRWLARERAKAMQPRYVATMVIETTFLSRLYVIGGTRV